MFRQFHHQSQRFITIFHGLRAKTFYESLQVSPTSTQAEIKDAYYKLSMIYHPDKNTSSEAAAKFRSITEAYEVLKNTRLRKMYDKGLFIKQDITVEEEVNKFYKSRQHRSKPPPPSGKTPIYDFDEWSKSHYGATLARDFARKRRRTADKVNAEVDMEQSKKEKILFLALFGLALFLYFYYDLVEDYDDVDKTSPNRKR